MTVQREDPNRLSRDEARVLTAAAWFTLAALALSLVFIGLGEDRWLAPLLLSGVLVTAIVGLFRLRDHDDIDT